MSEVRQKILIETQLTHLSDFFKVFRNAAGEPLFDTSNENDPLKLLMSKLQINPAPSSVPYTFTLEGLSMREVEIDVATHEA